MVPDDFVPFYGYILDYGFGCISRVSIPVFGMPCVLEYAVVQCKTQPLWSYNKPFINKAYICVCISCERLGVKADVLK